MKPARFLSRVFRPDCCALGAGMGSLCRLVVGVSGLGRSVSRQDDFYQPPPATADFFPPFPSLIAEIPLLLAFKMHGKSQDLNYTWENATVLSVGSPSLPLGSRLIKWLLWSF